MDEGSAWLVGAGSKREREDSGGLGKESAARIRPGIMRRLASVGKSRAEKE